MPQLFTYFLMLLINGTFFFCSIRRFDFQGIVQLLVYWGRLIYRILKVILISYYHAYMNIYLEIKILLN